MKNKRNKIVDIIGWTGTALIILAYLLLSIGILNARSFFYQIMNLLGAFGVLFEAFNRKDYEPVVINAFWLLIAIFAIIKILFIR